MEQLLQYECKCKGKLKKSKAEVEFFGIDFGIRECDVCTKCGSEYLDNETLKEIEQEIKKRKLFGLEQIIRVTKSGNSIVVRIPQEIAKFSDIRYRSLVRIFPVEKGRIEIEVTK